MVAWIGVERIYTQARILKSAVSVSPEIDDVGASVRFA
jgi:hypothetical protein